MGRSGEAHAHPRAVKGSTGCTRAAVCLTRLSATTDCVSDPWGSVHECTCVRAHVCICVFGMTACRPVFAWGTWIAVSLCTCVHVLTVRGHRYRGMS